MKTEAELGVIQPQATKAEDSQVPSEVRKRQAEILSSSLRGEQGSADNLSLNL